MKVPENEKDPVEQGNKYSCALCPYSTNILKHHKQHLVIHSSDKPFKCPECPYRAKLKHCVQRHVKNVHRLKSPSSRPFPCPESGCNYAAKTKYDLNSHSKIHSSEKSFFCSHPDCGYSTKQKGNLTVHSRTHSGEKPFVCQFGSCSFSTITLERLVIHSRIHTKERPFKCPEAICKYSGTTKSALKEHRLTHEPQDGEERPSFPCPLCEYFGKSKFHLSSHVKHKHTLEKWFKCDEPNCNFETKTKTEIKQHKVGHSDEKPFGCSFESCEYRCKWKQALAKHLKSHSEERRYKCELCPFRGKTRQVVRSHLNHVHSDPNFRPFKCPEPKCESAFKTKSNLNQHRLSHEGGKK